MKEYSDAELGLAPAGSIEAVEEILRQAGDLGGPSLP